MFEMRETVRGVKKGFVYSITGLLPKRYQMQLAEKYKWYNPENATVLSSIVESTLGVSLVGLNPIFLYPAIDGISRLLIARHKDLKLHTNYSVGTIALEVPVFVGERMYGKVFQKNISEVNNGLKLRNNGLERLLY